jgi:hypothetical protein
MIDAKRFPKKCHPRTMGMYLHDLGVITGLWRSGIPYVSLWKNVTLAFKCLVAGGHDSLGNLL